jgi:hypothetical protein
MTLVPLTSFALNVYIENPGFEADVLADGGAQWGMTGWATEIRAGTWNPGDGYFSVLNYGGSNVAFSNGPAISQVLDYTLKTNTELVLQADVGYRLDMSLLPEYELQLWAGGNLLASSSDSLIQGEFITSTLSYNVLDTDPIGQQLEIVLFNNNPGRYSQVNFDNISLHNQPLPVPEPSTLLLLGSGLLGLGYFIRRKKR